MGLCGRRDTRISARHTRQSWPKCSLPLWEWQEIQKVLWSVINHIKVCLDENTERRRADSHAITRSTLAGAARRLIGRLVASR